ncbi:hypothetical protein [Pseudomarimonas arenosa]|uniref:AMIN domain-containing protein n=1 Tax=Pseudomarimonas arenosa TaxID=2774145 RepID=A0AAW3ZHB2_9GAMM|nr:hypothetical protein [Pseudomarimonas arenosa]MBD8524387.1 hypothetical protein [Pseudomarimonas arenosa]
MIKRVRYLAVTFASLLSLLSFGQIVAAHSPPEPAKAYFGGYTRTTRTFNLELVSEGRVIRLYVRDRRNWPVDIRHLQARIQFTHLEETQEIELSPGAKGALVGEAEIDLAGLRRVRLDLHPRDQDPQVVWMQLTESD